MQCSDSHFFAIKKVGSKTLYNLPFNIYFINFQIVNNYNILHLPSGGAGRPGPQIYDDSRRMAVAGYDAVKDLGFCNPSRYPLININTAVVSSMMLGNPGPDGHDAEWELAAMFFENRCGIGNKSRGYIIKQSVIAVHDIVDAIANGELSSVNPDRRDEIPDRGSYIRTSDKWPNEWAE